MKHLSFSSSTSQQSLLGICIAACGIIFCISFFTSGCSKERLSDISGTSGSHHAALRSTYTFPGVSYSDGVIQFSSLVYFDSLIQAAMSDSTVLDDIYTQFSSHFSNYNAFLALVRDTTRIDSTDWTVSANQAAISNVITFVESNDTFRTEATITSGVLSHLANEDGLFVIGDTVYKITYNKVYAFSDAYLSSYSSYDDDLTSIPGVEIENISRTDLNECKHNYTLWGRKLQVTGEWSKEQWSIYNELRVTTKHRRYIWPYYLYYDTKALFHYGHVSYCHSFDQWGVPINPVTVYFEQGKTNCSKITLAIWFSSSGQFGPPNVIPPSYVTHQGKCPDDVWRECIISY
ncbi:MAG: hypothetical protein IPJ06_17485 [Saprospiraceae bacterium]|nr:hypothetical protein [Saprospiraceae bacterium]